MKQLIRRLSRVADSSSSSSSSTSASCPLLRSTSFPLRRSSKPPCRRSVSGSYVPSGHFPVYVGVDEMERFVVNAEMLNHPIFVRLLRRSAQEYGYEQQGVIRIPCRVAAFEQLLESLRIGDEDGVVDRIPDLFNLGMAGDDGDDDDDLSFNL